MSFGQRLAYVGIVIGIASGLTAAIVSIGTETRWPDILTLYFSGFAAGASLVAALRRRPTPKAVGDQKAATP
jgi:hypothetical protein